MARAPIVLIHGGLGTPGQWRPVIPLLEPHHEVLAPCLIGHSGGEPLPEGAEASIDTLVDGVERDMDVAGWEDAHVAGTSLGGLVALVLASRGRARSCTAMATIGGWDKGGDLGLRLVGRSYGLFSRVTRWMARNPAPWVRRPRLRRLLYWHHFARPEAMKPDTVAEILTGAADCTVIPALMAWARANEGPAGLDGIDCPVQLLFPEKDYVFPKRRYGARLTGLFPHAEVHDLPGVGHGATWEDPELVARHILAFTGR